MAEGEKVEGDLQILDNLALITVMDTDLSLDRIEVCAGQAFYAFK